MKESSAKTINLFMNCQDCDKYIKFITRMKRLEIMFAGNFRSTEEDIIEIRRSYMREFNTHLNKHFSDIPKEDQK